MSNTRGGARQGAGRPNTDNPKRKLSVRIKSDIYAKLEEISCNNEQTKTEIIEYALLSYFDIYKMIVEANNKNNERGTL